MKKGFFVTLTLLLFLTGNAQVDSLYSVLSKADDDYSKRVQVLQEIGKHYIKSMPDSAMFYGELMMEASVKENDSLNIALAYKLQGDAGIYGGNLKEAEINYLIAINIFNSLKRFDLVSDTKNNLGAVYQFSGQYEKGISLYKESLELEKNTNDTLSLSKTYNNIGSLYVKLGDNEKALEYLKKSLEYKQMYNDSAGIAKTLQNIGTIFFNENKYYKALDYYTQSSEIKLAIGDSLTISTVYSNIGLAYKKMYNYEYAIKYFLKSLRISHNVGYKKQEALVYNNLASAYEEWSELDSSNVFYKDKVVEYSIKSIDICKAIEDYEGLINAYKNFGMYYIDQKEHDKAMGYLKKCLTYTVRYNYKVKEAAVYVGVANIYMSKKENDKVLHFLNKSLKILESNPDNSVYTSVYYQLAQFYYAEDKLKKSKEYALKALSLSTNSNDYGFTKKIYNVLFLIYYSTRDYRMAYNYHVKYTHLKDSIFNTKTKNTILQLQTLYKTNEQKQEIKLLNTKNELNEIQLKAEKLKLRQQKIITIGLLLIVFLVLGFIYILYKQIKQKNRANRLLSEKNNKIYAQKSEIEIQLKVIKKQNTEITDSITYARLIQDAILPSVDILETFFKDYFVLFEPKSIVSGDFYWFAKYNNKIIITAVDCTGHGVPGAFMSMLGISFLNEIVGNNKELNSSEILNKLREQVIFALSQKDDSSMQRDGMDISLSIIDVDNKTIDFAGAYNPLFILTKNNAEIENSIGSSVTANDDFKLIELKADRMPISISRKMDGFNSTTIKYNSGDKLFMFSDGYVDQFNHKTLKKYKKSRFKQMILDSSSSSVGEQGDIFKDNLKDWKRDTEQTDDILVMGVEL